MRLLERSKRDAAGLSMGEWIAQATATYSFNGNQYTLPVQTTMPGQKAETVQGTFEGYVLGGLQSNGVVFNLASVRMRVFSEARLMWQQMRSGRPGDLFGNADLARFERPWPGGTTGDLLAGMLLHSDFGGNAYVVDAGTELALLRPDWVDILLGGRLLPTGERIGYRKVGYAYWPDGNRQGDPVTLLPDEVAHFAPQPDPLANFRGMSWLTPVIREMQADAAATTHKLKFFENAAPQPLDAKILTPSGWSTMGEMAPGAHVIGSDGQPHRVMDVFPQGERDIYRVTFQGGASTECTLDHVWAVSNTYDRHRGVTRTLSLRQLLDGGLRYRSGASKWAVPLPDPVEYGVDPVLPVDPYLLGLLLGDGSFRGNGKRSGGVSLACARADADETAEAITPVLPPSVSISRRDRGGWSEFYFRGPGGTSPNPLTMAIRSLGLFDVPGGDKFIPEAYRLAAVKDRVAVLQGLVDSDGSVAPDGAVRFTSASPALAADVAGIVRSLGGMASIRSNGGRRTLTVYIARLPEWVIPARLARKADRCRLRGARSLTIVDIEHVGRAEAQCIRVDVDDHLYVTDDFILTHNTPNLAVSLKEVTDPEKFEEFVDKMDAAHRGASQAYKTLYLGAGADVTVVGANMQQLDFKVTQGAGETRLAAAAGVPPVVANLSEGMQGSALNAGNFGQARRQFADVTMSPLWRNAAGSLEVIATPPAGSRLWYDGRDIPFLREDQKDAAEIQAAEAQTIRTLTDGGFTAESVIAAVNAADFSLLKHTGMLSVQLQEPGAQVVSARSFEGFAEDPAVTNVMIRNELPPAPNVVVRNETPAPNVVVNVEPTPVSVAAPNVQVTNDVPVPSVRVDAPVTVQPADVVVADPPRTRRVVRDRSGNITKVVEE